MNAKLLKEQMIKLETNYGKDKFKITKEIYELWKEMFADCKEDVFKLAVDKCIKESDYAPNIAGVMKYYRAIDDEHIDLTETLVSQYRKICTVWPEDYDSDTLKTMAEYIRRFPNNMRKVEMIELTQRAISFSYNCDGCGRKDKPTIKEYIEGVR